MDPRVGAINELLQAQLRRRALEEVPAVIAAKWLDEAGLLKDSPSRPGLPLRKLLRAGRIGGAEQRPRSAHGRWYIGVTEGHAASAGKTAPERPTPRRSDGAKTTRPTGPSSSSTQKAARRRRERAARAYKPESIDLLLVAEAPPAASDRYFYFDSVGTHDSLFRYVARSILKTQPTRSNKPELLRRLRDSGVFLIDLRPDPADGTPHAAYVPGLVKRARRAQAERIVLIKASVYDAAYRALAEAGLPVIDERVPFPGSGQQRRFEEAFARALTKRPGHRK